MEEPSSSQFDNLRDCLARRLIAQSPSDPSNPDSTDTIEELDDFTRYLALELWSTLPLALQDASYETRESIPDVDTLLLEDFLSPALVDTLITYRLGVSNSTFRTRETDPDHDRDAAVSFVRRILADYATEVCAAPPPWGSTRTTECEICEREVPLTYHHLIPRSTHAKALKKGWHPAAMLNSVAWLCRPCHSAVHGVASNERLAKDYHTVELLLAREDIQKWRKYAAKQRWGSIRFQKNGSREV